MRSRRFVVVSCAGLLALALGVSSGARGDDVKGPAAADRTSPEWKQAEEARKQRQEKLLKAAEDYASAVSGGKQDTLYFQALEYAIRGTKRLGEPVVAGPRAFEEEPLHLAPVEPKTTVPMSPFAAMRLGTQARTAFRQSIKTDPTWIRNQKRLIQEARATDPGRIFGGVRVQPGEFPDCVAIGNAAGCRCTGTLIGPNVVLTAGHCSAGGCTTTVFFGDDPRQPDRTVPVKKSIRHPDFASTPTGLTNDLTVLILEQEVNNVAPRPLASKQDTDNAFFLRLAGYGLNEQGVIDIKSTVDVAIASNDCGATDAQSKFGCNAGQEIVAGGNGLDSCNGDSGGPAYIQVGNRLFLAGATSRATANAVNNCGDGGIYVRVDKYAHWIRKTAQDHGGKLH